MRRLTPAPTWRNFLWDWLCSCGVYWLVFSLIEYVRRGRYHARMELVIAVVISLVASSSRALWRLYRRGRPPTRPAQPEV